MGKLVETLKAKAKAVGPALLVLGAAFAQTATTDPTLDPNSFDVTSITSKILGYLGVIGAGGVTVLAASVGLAAAFKYIRRFFRG